ncbi:MAG: voltage-gated potassium channel [Thermoplasmata archaeon]|jgi:voltage-gated potassium channel|nr:voltage-gated potassium channel [Thermoplasmata archaeon]
MSEPAKPFRVRVFETLDTDPETEPGLYWITLGLIALIAANALAVILESVDALEASYHGWFRAFEYASLAIFSVEYLLRAWSITADPRYQKPFVGRLRYVVTPAALIDLAAIAPSLVILLGGGGADLRFLFLLRFFRLFRLLKLGRYTPAVHHLSEVFKEKRADLTVALGAAMVMLVLSSCVLYIAERDAQPDKFGNIPESMWWSIITLTTIGYGDVYPVTVLGKIAGGATALIGVGIVALPTAILASGFHDRVTKRKTLVPDEPKKLPAQQCPHCGHQFHAQLAEAPAR